MLAPTIACALSTAYAQPLDLSLSRTLRTVPSPVTAEPSQLQASRCTQPLPAVPQVLTLMGALEHVVCRSPLLTQALLLVDERDAGVALARSAWRPRFSATAELATNRVPSSNSDAGALASSVTGWVGMSWTVLDAGLRQANLTQSRFQLDSAVAAQDVAVLGAVNEATRLYVEAATARTRLDALLETEQVARLSLDAARAKHEAQVASQSERLQAETALAQASLDRLRAQGAWETARGLLAVSLGLPPDTQLELAAVTDAFPSPRLDASSTLLADDIKLQHPRVRGAVAEIAASRARLDAVRAQTRGSVALSMGAATTKDLSTVASRFERNLSASVVATIPFLDGPERRAQEAQATAQIASGEAALLQAQREIESELWRSVKLVRSEAESLEATMTLVSVASKSHEISLGRYRSGVGSILELLATQNALANAKAQLAQAQLARAQANLRLQVASGKMLIKP